MVKLFPAKIAPSIQWRDLWSAVLLPVLLLAFATTGLGLYGYLAVKQVVRQGIANDMQAIAKLKAEQIEHWLAERRDDAALIATAGFSHDLQQWLDSGRRYDGMKQHLLDELIVPNTSLGPRTFTLRSAEDGQVLLTTDSQPDTAAAQQQAVQAARLGRAILEDVHFSGQSIPPGRTRPKIRMGYFIPLLPGEGARPQAVLHIRMSPEDGLYPLLLSWPHHTGSAETMLASTKGDNFVYLNDLRHAPNSALRLTRPVAEPRLVASRVIREGEGFFEENDYRGMPTLAYGMKIEGTPWLLIAKIDQDEAYERLNAITLFMAIFCALLLMLAGAWLFERKREELRRAALFSEWEDLYQNAPCGYHSLDENGVFQRANQTQLKMLGYAREEIIGRMNIRRLLTEESLRKFQTYFSKVVAFEEIRDVDFELIRKDGTLLPIQVSASAIRDKNGRFLMTRTIIFDLSERKAMEDQLRRGEERFRTLFRSIRDQVFVREMLADGGPGRLIEVNDVACEQLGYSRDELLAQPPFHLYPKPPSESELANYFQALEGGENVVIEQTQRTKDGRLIPVEISSNQVTLHGRMLRIALVRDISERKRNEEALRLLRRAIESSADGVMITGRTDDAKPDIQYINPAFEKMTGYRADEVLGRRPYFLHGSPQDEAPLADLYRAFEAGRAARATIRMLRKDGSDFCCEVLASPVMDERDQTTHYVASFNDVTSRMAIEAELLESREQLRKLASHDDGVREIERKNIARELHDELGQLLTVLKMNISLLQMRYDELPDLVEKTEEMRLLVEKTIGVVRNTVSNLRPAALDLGIVGALEWLVEDFARHTGVACRYTGQDAEPVLDEKLATVVFRIAQESLTNIARHAAARNVEVRLVCDHGILRLFIDDDGCGFDPSAITRDHSHFGLLGMQERVTMLNGEFQISSSPGKGARVSIEIPLAPLNDPRPP